MTPSGVLGTSTGGPAIAEVTAKTVRIPLPEPTRFSTRVVTHREYVLVWLRGDDGSEGFGYAYAGDSAGRWLTAAVAELIAPWLVGRDVGDIVHNHDAIEQQFLLVARGGGFARALSAVDIAAWDLLARRAGLPLRQLLGGTATEVSAYASGGYHREGDPERLVAEEVEHYLELGFRDYKMKVGRLSLAEDLARVKAARRTLGSSGRLALDANNAWRSAAEALRAAHTFAECDIWWFEEPLAPDDVEGHATVRHGSPMPVATGELLAGRAGFAQLLRREAVDILQPDAGVMGGVTEWLRVAAAAATFDVEVAPHWHANLHAQLAAATPNCLTVEYFASDSHIYNFEELVANPLSIVEGRIALDDEAGIGVRLDMDAVAHYEV
jgi:L-alanine-DL-glutamate epimerase-like enolase superfamily enzyme